jgi:HB1, ASXL, restriction endonuclease HTH domain
MAEQTQYKSLREAILAVLGVQGAPMAAKELVTRALELHPLPGKTPRATAAAQLAALVKAGTVVRTERAVYELVTPEEHA